MINKYSDFILESLLLESNVIFSNSFKKILSNINNKIAKEILDMENKDYPVRNNFFDISKDKNDTITFITDAKAKEIGYKKQYAYIGDGGGRLTASSTNNRIFNVLGYPEGKTSYRPTRGEIGTEVSSMVSSTGKKWIYLKFENNEEGVYNLEKLREVNNDEYWSKNRQEIRVGRLVRALLPLTKYKFTDKDVEDFVNLYKAEIDKANNIFINMEIVKGDKIAYWYNMDNYLSKNSGTLGNSCMRYEECEDYFQIYIENPDVCSLLILKTDEDEDDIKIKGRALVWTLMDGKIFMDRVYTNRDSDVNLFNEYASKMGWYKRETGHYMPSHAISPSGNREKVDLVVKVGKSSYEYYPYLDTLKYFKNSILYAYQVDKSILLESTDGEYICQTCDNEKVITCTNCRGDGVVDCTECDGSNDECFVCDGGGDIGCTVCDGEGYMSCPACT